MSPETIINELQKAFVNDHFKFAFTVSMYLAGDHNRRVRQAIIQIVTGEKKPANKCGIHAVEIALNAKFTQHELF